MKPNNTFQLIFPLLLFGTAPPMQAEAFSHHAALTASLSPLATQATLCGRVVDARTGESLPDVTLQVVQAGRTTVSDNDGAFTIGGLGQRAYTLTASYLGYKRTTLSVNPARTDTVLVVRMEEILGMATVTAQAKHNTDSPHSNRQSQREFHAGFVCFSTHSVTFPLHFARFTLPLQIKRAQQR